MKTEWELLDEAVEEARRHGYEVTGWTLQYDGEGYVAWLYHEEDEQTSVFSTADVHESPREAALECFLAAGRLSYVEWNVGDN